VPGRLRGAAPGNARSANGGLGARTSYLIYRRSEKEMPARAEEVHHAKDEGIEFVCLTNPVAFLGDDRGWLRAVRCVRMELGAPDASGRRSPVAVPGSEFEVPIQMAVIALGTGANPLVQATTPDLRTNRKGYIAADPETLQTSKAGVFAAGDIVTGSATVILAMAAGRKAARAISDYLCPKQESGAFRGRHCGTTPSLHSRAAPGPRAGGR
jgi:glutamate synthase (NADPH/NADH) small chain